MEIPVPTQTTPIESNRRGRKPSDEANPFVDEGWLWAQYEAVTALIESGKDPEAATLSVTVPGGWEERQATNRQRELLVDAETGEPIMVSTLVGDAAKVVKLLRKAADLHEIGVSVSPVPALKDPTKPPTERNMLKGMVEVKYLAKERTVKTRKGSETDE